MRISYYTYFVENDGECSQFNLYPLLLNFSRYRSRRFKNSFVSRSSGENYYLFHVIGQVFLFVMTKSREIIKSIDRGTINHSDIYSTLQANQSLGFASYLYADNLFFGLASTVFGPKERQFVEFVNSLFIRLGGGQYEFSVNALLREATRDSVLRLPMLGRTKFEVSDSNPLFQHLVEFSGGDATNLDSFEIVIKPRKRKDVTGLVRSFDALIGQDGVDKYIVRAKEALDTALTDFYIVGKGCLQDAISSHRKTDAEIFNQMVTKVAGNELLNAKIREFRDDTAYLGAEIRFISRFSQSRNWVDLPISDPVV